MWTQSCQDTASLDELLPPALSVQTWPAWQCTPRASPLSLALASLLEKVLTGEGGGTGAFVDI